MVFVNEQEYNNWKGGDTSIALALVVDSFDIFSSGQGSQGVLGKISKQTMETVFETKKEDDAVKKILELGTLKSGDGIKGMGDSRNDHRGANINTRGSGGSLTG